MRMLLPTLSAAGMLLVTITGSATVRPHHHTSTHPLVRRSEMSHAHHASSEHAAVSGISSERAAQIQTALIQRGYLTGEPTGTWDSASYAAMQKMQGDNGWQTKLVPDSRALIKLGLGPGSTPPSSPVPATDGLAAAQMPDPVAN